MRVKTNMGTFIIWRVYIIQYVLKMGELGNALVFGWLFRLR